MRSINRNLHYLNNISRKSRPSLNLELLGIVKMATNIEVTKNLKFILKLFNN